MHASSVPETTAPTFCIGVPYLTHSSSIWLLGLSNPLTTSTISGTYQMGNYYMVHRWPPNFSLHQAHIPIRAIHLSVATRIPIRLPPNCLCVPHNIYSTLPLIGRIKGLDLVSSLSQRTMSMLTVAQQHAASGRRASTSLDDTWSMFVKGSGGGPATTVGAVPPVPHLTGSNPSVPLNGTWMCDADAVALGLVMCSTCAEDGDVDDIPLSRPLALRVNADALRGGTAGLPPHTAAGWDNVCCSEMSTPAAAPEELWHEVTVQPFIDPTTGEAALLITQSDATGRAKTEKTLSKMVEVRALPLPDWRN